MRVGILGPLAVHVAERPVPITGARLRALLTRLALDVGVPVGTDPLVGFLWQDCPPTDPANALQSLVSRLRRSLPDGTVIESAPGGYRLAVPPADVDAVRFELLVKQARAAGGRPREAADLLREALALWRGPALADVADLPAAAAPAARLTELRLAATEDRLEADLALGAHRELLPELAELVLRHPLRERLCGQLMLALHRSGRQAEALAAYDSMRQRLADQLGLDPSPALREVHLQVLRGDPARTPAAEVVASAGPVEAGSVHRTDADMWRRESSGSDPRRPEAPGPEPQDPERQRAQPRHPEPRGALWGRSRRGLDEGPGSDPVPDGRSGLRELLDSDLAADLQAAFLTRMAERARAMAASDRAEHPEDAGRVANSGVPGRRAVTTTGPTWLSSFVGRAQDVRAVSAQLLRTRLLSVVGTGGAGKTRLAVEVMAAPPVLDPSPTGTDSPPGAAPAWDRAWLAELAPVTDPAGIAGAVLAALDVRDSRRFESTPPRSRRDVLDLIADTLASGPTLLVLDNCEHLLTGAAQLAQELLARCPLLRVLVTSREPLGIFGEVVHPLSPLEAPSPDADVEAALAFPAVQLFVDRAVAVRPGFRVDESTVRPVVEICRRLDGLPLALELAAARCRALPVEHVAARLDDRFRLLTGGSRTAVPRHRTLHAVVTWSWDLLEDSERRLAERLAVFGGGVSPEAAHGVHTAVGGYRGGAEDTLDLLTALADKSLLQVVEGAEPRFRMLETLREYGWERLAERGETDLVRSCHLDHFLALAETADPQLRGRDQLRWLSLLSLERDNLYAALRHAVDSADVRRATRLAAALSWYWTIVESRAEASTWVGAVAALPGFREETSEAAAIVTMLHVLSLASEGAMPPSELVGAELTGRLAALDVTRGHPMLALAATLAAIFQDDEAKALATLDAVSVHPDPWVRAAVPLMRAVIGENLGDNSEVLVLVEVALASFRELGDRWGIAMCLAVLGEARTLRGDPAGAVIAYQEGIGLFRELNSQGDADLQLIRVAGAMARAGDQEGAHVVLLKAQEAARASGQVSVLVLGECLLADLARQRGDLTEARRVLDGALTRIEDVDGLLPQARVFIGSSAAHLELAEGRIDEARGHLTETMTAARSSRDMPATVVGAVAVAAYLQARGRSEDAAEALGAAAALVGGLRDRTDPDLIAVEREVRSALGDAAFTLRFGTGVALSRSDALTRVEELIAAG